MSKRILVIDDDEDILEILNIVFKQGGYDVVLSKTGEEVTHLQVIHPDLVLLDVRIAGHAKTGVELCADIKERYQNKIPVVLISAEYHLEEMAGSCGADAYITKPFDINEILSSINKLIN